MCSAGSCTHLLRSSQLMLYSVAASKQTAAGSMRFYVGLPSVTSTLRLPIVVCTLIAILWKLAPVMTMRHRTNDLQFFPKPNLPLAPYWLPHRSCWWLLAHLLFFYIFLAVSGMQLQLLVHVFLQSLFPCSLTRDSHQIFADAEQQAPSLHRRTSTST